MLTMMMEIEGLLRTKLYRRWGCRPGLSRRARDLLRFFDRWETGVDGAGGDARSNTGQE